MTPIRNILSTSVIPFSFLFSLNRKIINVNYQKKFWENSENINALSSAAWRCLTEFTERTSNTVGALERFNRESFDNGSRTRMPSNEVTQLRRTLQKQNAVNIPQRGRDRNGNTIGGFGVFATICEIWAIWRMQTEIYLFNMFVICKKTNWSVGINYGFTDILFVRFFLLRNLTEFIFCCA